MRNAGFDHERAFRVATITVVALVVVCFVASFFTGDSLSGQSIGRLEGIRDAGGKSLGRSLSTSAMLRATGAVLAGTWILVAAVYALWAFRVRWFLWPLAVLAWWCLFELFVSPFLAGPLNLWTYEIASKVDHRPTNTDGEFNADSLRGTSDSSEFLPGARNVVFLGDSFTFGSGVEVEQSFVKRFESQWNAAHPEFSVRTANFGWVSSSPLLSLRRLRDVGEKYHPRLVVMCFDMTDFTDDIRAENVLERRGLYALYDKLPITLKLFEDAFPDFYQSTVSWSLGSARQKPFFASQNPLDDSRPWMEVTLGYLREIGAWCRAHGAAYVVVVLPRCYQYDEREAPRSFERAYYTTLGPFSLEPFRWFDELKSKEPFPIVSLLPDFQAKVAFPTCFEDDPHWTPAGHAVAADALVRDLEPYVSR